MLNQKEAANFLSISVYTLNNWVKKGFVKTFKTQGGHRRYIKEDLLHLVYKNKNIFLEKICKKHNLDSSWFVKTNYLNNRTLLILTCPKHGDFDETPVNLLSIKFPCPKCRKELKNQKSKSRDRLMEKKYIGKVYGSKKIIQHLGIKNKHRLWLTECINCGHKLNNRIEYLKKFPNSRCINCKNRKKGCTGALYVFNEYIASAKKRNLIFDISLQEFMEITSKNCTYCGAEPRLHNRTNLKYSEFYCTGIDRIDNTKGYIKENCVSCCKTCNSLKLDRSIDEFKIHIKQLIEFRKNKKMENKNG